MRDKTVAWTQLGESPVRQRLESGLEIFIVPKPGLKKTYATYATHYGSIDSHFRPPGATQRVDVPDGIAHFLEHKMYEKPEGHDVFSRFASLGAYTNAYTEYTSTTFLFSATSEIDKCLETLLTLVEEPYFTQDNVEKEKGIIEQEIRMYLDMPGDRLHSNLMHALYHDNPVRLDIAGSVDSIRTITPDDLYLCYETFYHPSNMVLFIAGDVDAERLISQVARWENRRQVKPGGTIQRIFPNEPNEVLQKHVEQSMPVAAPLWMMGYKGNVHHHSGIELLRNDLIMSFLWGLLLGPSSPLFNDLYQQGLINQRFSAHYTSAPTYGVSLMGGETPDPERLESVLVNRLASFPLREADLARMKRRELGEFIGLFENLENLAYVFNAFSFRGIDLGMVPDVIQDITLEEIEEARREHLAEERRAVSVIVPSE